MLPKVLLLGGAVILLAVDVNAYVKVPDEIENRHNNSNGITETVMFYMYTRDNVGNPERILPGGKNKMLKDRINYPFKIFSHGFFEGGSGIRATLMVTSYLKHMDVNVILVDWGDEAKVPFYPVVAKETAAIGRYLAELIEFIVDEGAPVKNFHLIGFSLGSHVVGSAAKVVKRSFKLPRITGLDPAGPGFHTVSPAERLDKSDADFVDIIHTCGGIYGLYQQIGHADFYVNGGMHPQPGCNVVTDAAVCSHLRAVYLYADAINPRYKFRATRCRFAPFKYDCLLGTHYNMGPYVDTSAHGMFYVETTGSEPFVPDQ